MGKIPLRAEVTFLVEEDVTIPFNYQHLLMGVIYELIALSSKDIAEKLHSMDKPKPFTFSWIRGKTTRVMEKGIFYSKETPLKLTISSWEDEIIDLIGMALLSKDTIRLGEAKLFVTSFRSYTRELESGRKMVALSPIVVSKGKKKGDKIYHEFLGPDDPEFFERLTDSLRKRYELYTGKSAGEIRILPDVKYVNTHRTSKLVDIKGTKVRGHIFPFILEGSVELIEFVYYAGLGERTGQGFGCIEIYDRE